MDAIAQTGLVLYMYSTGLETAMLALRLPAQIEKRLDALAKKTGRSKSFYAREAILRHLEDLEDYHLARRRLARKAPRVTLEELERELADIR
jgi:RHH-type transcriptional regulator, rel operon repressor / antitoxin RelB